jgi:hypothetical protein
LSPRRKKFRQEFSPESDVRPTSQESTADLPPPPRVTTVTFTTLAELGLPKPKHEPKTKIVEKKLAAGDVIKSKMSTVKIESPKLQKNLQKLSNQELIS